MESMHDHGKAAQSEPGLRNCLLAAVPVADRNWSSASLRETYLPLGSVLYESGDTLHHVCFPVDCVVSLLRESRDGSPAGIATIGNEGVVGLELFLGSDTIGNRAVVQNGGFAYCLTTAMFHQEVGLHGELARAILRYTQVLLTQMAQTVVCNTHHSVDQRLCRWLLESLDRTSSSGLATTHDLIASFLGVRREGITLAAKRLQTQGIINYRRGKIVVLDRHRLERLSCECHGVVRKETDRMLRRVPRSVPSR